MRKKGKIATVTGILRNSQYGILTVKDGIATSFKEKENLDGIINGGFFVLNKEIFSRISDDDDCIFEKKPLQQLAEDGELAVYEHKGLWIAIDTLKDLKTANKIWKPSWK
jgi:glucose-1-phosphate cytidylyltransferase